MTAEQLLLFVITHMLIFGLAWLIQDYRYAGRQLERVKDDFKRTKEKCEAQ